MRRLAAAGRPLTRLAAAGHLRVVAAAGHLRNLAAVTLRKQAAAGQLRRLAADGDHAPLSPTAATLRYDMPDRSRSTSFLHAPSPPAAGPPVAAAAPAKLLARAGTLPPSRLARAGSDFGRIGEDGGGRRYAGGGGQFSRRQKIRLRLRILLER
jgi:hypothetical protein